MPKELESDIQNAIVQYMERQGSVMKVTCPLASTLVRLPEDDRKTVFEAVWDSIVDSSDREAYRNAYSMAIVNQHPKWLVILESHLVAWLLHSDESSSVD